MNGTPPGSPTLGEFISTSFNVFSASVNLLQAAKKTALEAKAFIKIQYDYVKANDEKLHRIWLAAVSLLLLYLGGFWGVISFSVSTAGAVFLKDHIRITIPKIQLMWQESKLSRAAVFTGCFLFAFRYPWVTACTLFGIYVADMIVQPQRSLQERDHAHPDST